MKILLFFLLFVKEKIRKIREEKREKKQTRSVCLEEIGKKVTKNMTPQQILKIQKDLKEAEDECSFKLPLTVCLLIIWIVFSVVIFRS